MKIITDNREARFDFFLEDKFEAGIELLGWEVKSARAGTVNLKDSFVYLDDGQAVLKNAHFSPYQFGDTKTQDVTRNRRLLLNKTEINKIHSAVTAKGLTCVPVKMYFNPAGRVKVEIAIAKGKHNYDKRETIKRRDIEREMKKEL